mmetsp:Transcript_9304/g.40591  ORF Transcript_9304/g.40591 Transcript_9304/m.40591 type:complete len:367 (-) Transcript_9304:55-1155(-)|eukprot:CAMPEP_0113954742 /NCGR_PEP_ID=MMETSP0011_2-20120614/798_1 /TAXON_ID=101924 /ORGANISM="Rhodosorus marinus" /LENGTH=366 /DNA_ID=CAMNT_0000964057 /DNA_START=265 /DNA_END=1365 /DNA_ORIENTATION=+ /assembly_acc=CAM_ASM_000156
MAADELLSAEDRKRKAAKGAEVGQKEGESEQLAFPSADGKYLSHLTGCRSVENYERLNFVDEGTYGRVWRARDIESGTIYALKQVKLSKESEGFPITCLREINILLSLRHENIVHVREVVVGSSMDLIFMVMEYCEHDLKEVLESMKKRKQQYSPSEVKSLMQQLLAGVNHLHENWVFHRDIKTSNLLVTNGGVLKVCDFGLARQFCDPSHDYTSTVVTLWYRAPEVLLGDKRYSRAIDMWSVGCIFAELFTLEPLLPGKGELDQLNLMSKMLGSPTEEIWPTMSQLPNARKVKFSKQPYNFLRKKFPTTLTNNGFDLLNRMLTYDPEKRITASEAMKHPFFTEPPLPVDPSLIQTFPVEHNRRNG